VRRTARNATASLAEVSLPTGALGEVSLPTGSLGQVSLPTGSLGQVSLPTGSLGQVSLSGGLLDPVVDTFGPVVPGLIATANGTLQQVGGLTTPLVDLAANAAPVPLPTSAPLRATGRLTEDLGHAVGFGDGTYSSGGTFLTLYPSSGGSHVCALGAFGEQDGVCLVTGAAVYPGNAREQPGAAAERNALTMALWPGAGWPAGLPDNPRAGRSLTSSLPVDSPPRTEPPHQAMPGPSSSTGCGDVTCPVEARVTEGHVPPWAAIRPAVRTTADEPPFSPD
jgi:hypothetical protein